MEGILISNSGERVTVFLHAAKEETCFLAN